MNAFDGFLLIDKPAGMTSFGVVARVRRRLTLAAGKKIKVGHTGTLDPFATGLMILVAGSYCKRAGEFSKLAKCYVATMRLGQISTTGDPEGELAMVNDRQPSVADIKKVLTQFVGDIRQIPPAYSAIKINGERAYKLARKGHEVAMPARTITVKRIVLLDYAYPRVTIECEVSSGTYIRTLAADIGRQLGIGAYCMELRRTQVGQWKVEEAQLVDAQVLTLQQI